ncbi:MAG: hypothetical protein ACI8RD_006272 [Bacillariaceae sp.]|jgi:hypothetical protein
MKNLPIFILNRPKSSSWFPFCGQEGMRGGVESRILFVLVFRCWADNCAGITSSFAQDLEVPRTRGGLNDK